ncbi:MAG: hypothetical protein PUD79_03125 [Prevotellaceae bacterium]|nr:hypothetical protein [Prevotellaceae bacterium]
MKLIPHILFVLVLLLSCTDERQGLDNSVKRLDISFDEPQMRSVWNDLSETQDKVSYVWENNTNMFTAIKHNGEYVPFYASLYSEPQYHSDTKFETVDPEKSKIKLQTVMGVKYEVGEDGEYIYPVAVDDAMYCLHPTHPAHSVNKYTEVVSNANEARVDMYLPMLFDYSSIDNDLSSLSDYSYVYTSTTIKSVDVNDVVAEASHFNSACAIIRFNVTNKTSTDINISNIKMESDNASHIFPNVLRFKEGTIGEQPAADTLLYYSKLITRIANGSEAVTLPKDQKGIFYNLCFPLDGDFNSVPLKFTIDTNYLTYQLRLNSDVIPNNKFEAGKIYTFNFSLEEKAIRLNTIDISLCTTYNIDKTESLNIVVSPEAVWDNVGDATAQMVFVSLGMTTTIGGKDYDVLWATCNLGAKEAIETGNHYAWGETETKGSGLYSPTGYVGGFKTDISNTEFDAVKQYLGEGYWLWCMPTKEMWEDIINNCTWTWKPVKKVGEELDFDASVWEVTKRNDETHELVGVIYLPITGYSGLDESTGKYTKVNKARCCFWTSTPASSVEGAEEKSWAFVTVYDIDSEGNGHMTAHNSAMVKSERYNGYSIRPVLLKEKYKK